MKAAILFLSLSEVIFVEMPRQKAPRQKMMNPLAGAGGGAPNQQFLGIGNPNGAQINFNNDELEAELNDLLGEDRPKAAQVKIGSEKVRICPVDFS